MVQGTFFCLDFDILQGGKGWVDPNPNMFEALLCLNLDIIAIFPRTLFGLKKVPWQCPTKHGGRGGGVKAILTISKYEQFFTGWLT